MSSWSPAGTFLPASPADLRPVFVRYFVRRQGVRCTAKNHRPRARDLFRSTGGRIGGLPAIALLVAAAAASAAAPAARSGALLLGAVRLWSPPRPSDVVMVSSRNLPARLASRPAAGVRTFLCTPPRRTLQRKNHPRPHSPPGRASSAARSES